MTKLATPIYVNLYDLYDAVRKAHNDKQGDNNLTTTIKISSSGENTVKLEQLVKNDPIEDDSVLLNEIEIY